MNNVVSTVAALSVALRDGAGFLFDWITRMPEEQRTFPLYWGGGCLWVTDRIILQRLTLPVIYGTNVPPDGYYNISRHNPTIWNFYPAEPPSQSRWHNPIQSEDFGFLLAWNKTANLHRYVRLGNGESYGQMLAFANTGASAIRGSAWLNVDELILALPSRREYNKHKQNMVIKMFVPELSEQKLGEGHYRIDMSHGRSVLFHEGCWTNTSERIFDTKISG